MQLAHRTLHRRLDELALEALGPPQLPVAYVAENEVSIEVVYGEDVDECAVTGQFVRFSAPYERVEIAEVPSLAAFRVRASRPTTFARTISAAQVASRAVTAKPVPPSATMPFERVWFDEEPDATVAEAAPKTSWWWLALSLALGGAAVACLALS